LPRSSRADRSLTSAPLRGASPIEVTLDIVVRSTEIDINGHVNNAKFVEYLEWGREEWYERNGFPHERLLQLGAITVAVNLNLNYRKECRQGEALRVTTRAERRGRTSFVVSQRIVNASGQTVADAAITIVTIDPITRKSRPLPEPFALLFPVP
jgi:YbgC/YbaW family acyl-CoA thioester hydrolase